MYQHLALIMYIKVVGDVVQIDGYEGMYGKGVN